MHTQFWWGQATRLSGRAKLASTLEERFSNWERKIKATGGHINIKAELEAATEEKPPAAAPSTAPATAPAKDGIQVH